MKMAMSPTREKYPLSEKKIIKKTLGSMIGWTIFLLFLYIPGVFLMIPISQLLHGDTGTYILFFLLSGLLLFVAILVWTILYQRWYFETYFYEFSEHFVQIRKGAFLPKEISIPYERVQDVYVDQDLFDRIFNLYDVHLSTATYTSGMEAHIDGVEKPAAEGLREFLTSQISAKLNRNPQGAPSAANKSK